ncbi:hypothetical protein N8T08_006244 [Aspergillus melleus]|uniref:Uncharacterized protein n=1 Tax=Aspergillus melleus TaxID=138277 RepID=A0ACC3B0K0_9EURO|nr:hypothetical protein N8T08_006244 [Aspergillus melleus]
MSGSDVEHVSCFLNGNPHQPRHQSSPTPDDDYFYDAPSHTVSLIAPASPPVPSLASTTTYTEQPRLTSSQAFRIPADLSSNDYPESCGRDSPDPDDFYRPHQTSLAAEDGVGVDPDATLMVGVKNNDATEKRPALSQRIYSLPTHPPNVTSASREPYRSTSDSSYRGVGLNTAKGPSVRASTARSRQTSFKDLINKFNNNVDQVLPVPTASTPISREPSRAASPASPVDPSFRPKPLSYRRDTFDSLPDTNGFSRLNSPLTSGQASSDLIPPPLRKYPEGPSLTPLQPTESQPRRPVFGELLSVDTGFRDSGYGQPSPLRRRGSEGSVPSPNPALIDQLEPPFSFSPLTPTAWYLGKTPFLEAVNNGANPNSHRRVRSDLSGHWLGGAPAPPSESHMAVSGPLQPHPEPPLESPHSKSRIPISSRRLNSAPGSEASSPTASPTFGNRPHAQIPLPPKGVSRLPKPALKSARDIPDDGQAAFALSPRTRREMAHGRSRHQQPPKGALLEAYIAAPPPKKSPPLRSSRPRQPVSHAPPSSRSKVVETVSNFQNQINRDRDPRNLRQRRLPELGNVDFATRRHRIQQAFNRTVQENEQKEERAAELRRQVKSQDDREERPRTPTTSTSFLHENPQPQTSPQPDDTATVIDESTETCHEENHSISETGPARATPKLHVDTDVGLQENQGDSTEDHPVTMDSPTLGHAIIASNGQDADPKLSGLPASAVTSTSDETHVTAFDPEPQAELSRQNLHASHRTLLSQIMQTRESSPSSSSCDEPDLSYSDNDDKESIPIMLRDALGLEDSMDSSDNQESCDLYMKQGPTASEPPNRWSLSSWSSSLQNQHSTDDQCEGSGDDLSHAQHSADDCEIATTQSCSAASSTPASVAGDHQLQSSSSSNLINNTAPQMNLGGTPTRNAYRYSNAPSLARLGGWDSRRVTQLYFEELARGRGHNLPMPAVRATPEPRQSDNKSDSLADDAVVVSRPEDLPSERMGHSASLVLRDDWEHASPSIMDWMQVAAHNESGPKDQTGESTKYQGDPTPRIVTPITQGLRPEDGTDEGLGLAINVQSSLERDSSQTNPPAPNHEPPLPPSSVDANEDGTVPQQASAFSPGMVSAKASLSTFASGAFAPLGPVQSSGSSGDSSLRRADRPHSPHALDSSATSLVPSTSEPPRIDNASPSPDQRRLKKRKHVIKELVDTEYTFGRDMKVVDDIYKGTSSSCLDLSSEDVKILFANSDQVVQFSQGFQDALKEAAKSVYIMPKSQRWSSKRSRNHHVPQTDADTPTGTGISELEKDTATFIGRAFVTNMTYMEKVYADYLRNHDAANKKLQALQRNPKVAIWLKECRDWASDLTTAWDLDSLLVKPVQRILKYPLLLSELLDSTPSDHPDRASLVTALEEVTNISVRINEMKKRADLVGQVVARKRKDSDVRTGLSKAFGRRTEKLRQQVGLSDLVEDKEYDNLAQRFGDNFFQLQVVMRDAEMYTREAQGSIDCLNEFVMAIEGLIDVSQTNYSELEGKWRELKVCVQDIVTTALPEHLAVVRKSVIEPMVTLLKLHDGPQRVMKKRDKRLMDYARFKSIKERGDKPDKKTAEQGEQYVALNETLKDELPKLYSLTAKLMEACLKNFVQIQTTWFNRLQEKLTPLVDAFPEDVHNLVDDWSATFNFSEAQVLSLGICNGSLLADAVNLVNFNTPSTGATISSPRRPSTVNSVSTRVGSTMEEASPKASYDFSSGIHPFQSPSIDSQSQLSHGRLRADSSYSGRAAPEAPEIPRSQLLQQITSASSGSVPPPSVTQTESFPSLPRLSLDSPFLADIIGPSTSSTKPDEDQPTSPAGRYSGFFSSAMPMSDNPQDESAPTEASASKEPTVLFLAASIYEFNIDRARREAGYPYLTYVAGEIFDVIAEKGELWLAKNQDDPTHQVGWIWNKHFAKLSS